MTIEIDCRTIPGVGEVRWRLEESGHVITLLDDSGAIRAQMTARDGVTARELFRHPFSWPDVPNLFANTHTPL